jgi:hypothetical protein
MSGNDDHVVETDAGAANHRTPEPFACTRAPGES